MEKYFEPKQPIRYMTSDIQHNLPAMLDLFLWDCINKAGVETCLDYLQVFKLYTEIEEGKLIQYIEHSQEQPPFTKEYKLEAIGEGVNDTVYVIDDITHQTMLFARNY